MGAMWSDVISAGWPRATPNSETWPLRTLSVLILSAPLSPSSLFYPRLVRNVSCRSRLPNALPLPFWLITSYPTAFRPHLPVLQHPPVKRSFFFQKTFPDRLHAPKTVSYLSDGCEARGVSSSTVGSVEKICYNGSEHSSVFLSVNKFLAEAACRQQLREQLSPPTLS